MPINRVTIVGNLTRDPELRGLPSGGSVCTLRVAVNGRRRDQAGQWVDEPSYFNVTIFGNSADSAAKFLAKGRQVAVDGRLRWREWQDQQGNKRESVEIVAQEVQFIGGNQDGQPSAPPSPGGWGSPPTAPGPMPTQGFGTQQPEQQTGFGGPPPEAPQQGPHTDASDDIPF